MAAPVALPGNSYIPFPSFKTIKPYAESAWKQAAAMQGFLAKGVDQVRRGAYWTINVFDTVKGDPDALSKACSIAVRVISIAGEFTNVGRLTKLVESFHNGIDVMENAQIGETAAYFLKGKFLARNDTKAIDYRKSISFANLENVITKVGFSVAAIGGFASWLNGLKVVELAKYSATAFGAIGLTQVIQGGLIVGFAGTAKEAAVAAWSAGTAKDRRVNCIKLAWCAMELGLIGIQIAGFSVNPLAMSAAVIATKSVGLSHFLSIKWPNK